MRKKFFKRFAATALACMMVAQSASGVVVASAATQNQMASEKEVVYVNAYGTSAREQDFDDNWKFYLGEASGAEANGFDDSAWSTVNLPHDYSIEQEYTSKGEAESAYLLGGTGWYRKHFTVSSDMKGKSVRLDFGGVYMNATVWVNGTQLGVHPYGYTPFSFDISDYLNYDGENIVTVKVDHQTPSSRWYSGSGIYRSVYLTVMDEVHVDLYGTKVTTPNLEKEQNGTVNMNVVTTVANDGAQAADVVLTHTVYEKGTETSIGTVTTKATSVKAGEAAEITATLPAEKPALWDITDPNLYTVVTEVKVGDDVVDTYETEYGFRYFKFDKDTGFYLNGRSVKLKGVCMHHDQGALGAEAYARATERQVEILKEMGCNSIRVTHNPASNEMIEACNKLGILVIEEAFDGWLDVKNGNRYDYSNYFDVAIGAGNNLIDAEADMTWAEFDIKAMVQRGLNAPSIIMWSLGNEVQEGTNWASTNQFPQVAANLIKWVKEVDESRLVTNGDNVLKGLNTQAMLDVDAKIYEAGGVVGTNYSGGSQYDAIHNRYPNWLLVGSETASHVNSRGVYNVTGSQQLNSDKALTAYDYSAVNWGATASSAWYDVITRDFVAGEYVWTGFDYLGEPTPNNGTDAGWKNGSNSPKNSFFGIIDTAGLPKDNYYFYQSQWNDEVTTLHVLPAWNRDVLQNPNNVPVVVYSDAAKVNLTLTKADGTVKDLGTKEFTVKTTNAGYTYQMYEGSDKESQTHRNMYLTWYVPFEEGTITATAYDKAGKEIKDTVGRSFVTTTGNEAKLQATVDREEISADGKDLAYITVDVTDANGNIVPDAKNNIKFTVEGDGVLVGIDNGKQSDHQSFQDDNRDAFSGSLVAIVQSTKEAGEFKVTASSAGLTPASVTVKTEGTGTTADVGFYMSKNYYVKAGTAPVLPETVEAVYADGTREELPVAWAKVDASNYEKAGTFSVAGTVDGLYTVSVTVNVIDEVGGLLNYSTTTTVGTAPSLPAARPVVLVDGTILEATFAVEWDEVKAEDFAEEGIVVVEGTGNVFGKEIAVTASVRVQEAKYQIGSNLGPQALHVVQDIPEDKQSDTLMAIIDGSTEIADNNDGGANESAWSNYDNSDAGDNTAEIVIDYATQQLFGEFVIYFFKDGWSAEYPDAGTTKIQISENGETWVDLAATETIGEENNRVKAYTYSFTPVTATFIKFAFTNSSAQKNAGFSCTGVTEIELKGAEGGGFTVNTAAGFETITVNGAAPSEKDFAEGVMYVSAENAYVEAVGKDNAAVTVLPAYDGKIVVITESEDHAVRETFTILLGQERPVDPADASNDYPLADITYTTGSEQPGTGIEGPVKLAFDDNTETFWHSEWNPAWYPGDCSKYLWVDMELEEATMVNGIRILPRGGNGDIKTYRIEGSKDGGQTYEVIKEGQFDGSDWQVVQFKAQELTNVRLVALETTADSANNKFASAREIRVLKAAAPACEHAETELKDVKEATCTKDGYTGNEVCKECGAVVKAGETVKAAGHAYGEFVVVKEATTEEEGLKEATCANCGDVKTETIEKLPVVKPVNPFEDVIEGQYYYDPVLWAVEKGVTSGLNATTFGVGNDCTREQIVTFLWNYAGKPAATQTTCTFKDVNKDHYYYNAMLWANEKGYVSGYNADTFGVGDACTREQIVMILWKFAGEPAATQTTCTFKDADASHYYYNAMLWAVENGVVAGYNDAEFGVGDACTREQIVTFLYRYDNL